MRLLVLLVLLAACGGPEKPVLANAPHPDPGAVAGAAAAAAAAMTLVDPDAKTRGKPEKSGPDNTPKDPIEVKEQVPPSVLDHLDDQKGSGSAATSQPATKPAAAAAPKHKGPLPKLPSPKDAAEHEESH